MFNHNDTNRQGVWSGAATSAAVTRTKPSKTLFIASAPPEADLREIEALFSSQPGFLRYRTHRRMGFSDFMTCVVNGTASCIICLLINYCNDLSRSEFHSASAMRSLQGKVVGGFPLKIDYDKDPESKKAVVVERQQVDEELKRHLATADPYFCALCSTCCLHLSNVCSLATLPIRGTDGSSVVDEATQLRRLAVVRGPPRTIRREKGVERQFPVHCPSCDVPIGYRPAPLDAPSRFLYVHSGALKADKRGAVDVVTLLLGGKDESRSLVDAVPSAAAGGEVSGALSDSDAAHLRATPGGGAAGVVLLEAGLGSHASVGPFFAADKVDEHCKTQATASAERPADAPTAGSKRLRESPGAPCY